MNLFDVSAILLIGFAILSFVDGVYLHLYRFRLHARPETRREHWTHTARAFLFVPTLLFVLSGTSSGVWLWLGVATIVADLAVTIWDVSEERESRAFQGGLPRYELVIHVAVTALHVGAIATSLWARPAAAWWGVTEAHVSAAGFAHDVATVGLLGGSVIVAAAHVLLALSPRVASWLPAPRRADSAVVLEAA